MKHYIALLRGINVSGKNKIPMKELRELVSESGYEDIQTYIQSGNILFRSDRADEEIISEEIHEAIKSKYGFDVPVLVLCEEDWIDAFEGNPLIDKEIKFLYVTFLAESPQEIPTDELEKAKGAGEEYIIKEKLIYLYYPNGYGRTKMDNQLFERKLKVRATTRNWKTVTALREMLNAPKE